MSLDRQEILQKITELVVATNPELKAEQVTESSTFGTLGLDSIKLVELGVRVEQIFGEDVVLDDWVDEENQRGGESFTVGSLVAFIARTVS